jgi:hypothetical protein
MNLVSTISLSTTKFPSAMYMPKASLLDGAKPGGTGNPWDSPAPKQTGGASAAPSYNADDAKDAQPTTSSKGTRPKGRGSNRNKRSGVLGYDS